MSTNKLPIAASVDWIARLTELKSAAFQELYPAQEAALKAYSAQQEGKPNVAIELPTGAGKTLIALLILQYWMSKGKRTAVLCGTKNLARQFKAEADELGVAAVLFEGRKNSWSATDKFRYNRGNAVAVLNYWGYINQSPGLDPADIVVFDDAHLAENAAHGLFSIDITKAEHATLYSAIVGELAVAFPHYTTLTDYNEGSQTPFSPVELINFTDWLDFLPRFEAILSASSETKQGGNLFYAWGRLKRSLKAALCIVSGNSISVRPGSYPAASEAHIKKPQQRIYLSATIGTPDDLARRIGVPDIETLPIDAKYRLAVPGKRLLVFPDSEAREADMETIALESALRLRRSVWLCASGTEMSFWVRRLQAEMASRGINDQPIFVAKGEAEEIDQFIESQWGHLFTAARYDGMDFEGDTCRLVVIPSLPQACGPYERFISENLADASFMYSRVLQRMKQALGRATRNDHDWSVYVFLKNSLTHYLTSTEAFDYLPSNVQDEIGYGVSLSSKNSEELAKTVSAFVRGKLAEIEFPQKPVRFPEQESASRSDVANDEVIFWENSFALLSFDRAARAADAAATKLEHAKQPGYALFWRYLKAQALYLRYHMDNDPSGLAMSRAELSKILDEPRQSAWFSRLNRLRHSLNLEVVHDAIDLEEYDVIVASWNQLLGGELRNPKIHDSWLSSLHSGLMGSDHGAYCVCLKRLFNLLGWDAEVRDKIEGDTDVIATIGLGGAHYLIVAECKPEMDGHKPIPLRYVAQAIAQLERYENDVTLRSYKKAAVLISKSYLIDDAGSAAGQSLTFVGQSSLAELGKRAAAAFQRYASIRYKRGFLPKRSECVEALEMAPRALTPFQVTEQKGRVLSDDEVLKVAVRRAT